MKQYKWKFMSEEMLNEMEELLKGEHGRTLTVWSMECGKAGADGYRNSMIKGSLLGMACAGAAFGGMYLGKKIVDAFKKKTEEDAEEKDFEDV